MAYLVGQLSKNLLVSSYIVCFEFHETIVSRRMSIPITRERGPKFFILNRQLMVSIMSATFPKRLTTTRSSLYATTNRSASPRSLLEKYRHVSEFDCVNPTLKRDSSRVLF